MKNLLPFFLFLIALGNNISAQFDNSQLAERIIDICSNSTKWKYTVFNDSISVKYSGKFTTNTLLGSRTITEDELIKPDSNTLIITFNYVPNWTDSVYSNVKKNNASLIEEYAKHYDLIGWPVKTSRSTFIENPFNFLQNRDYKTDSLAKIIQRLPDFRIGTCGVFYHTNIDFSYWYIVQPPVREEIELFLLQLLQLDHYISGAMDLKSNY